MKNKPEKCGRCGRRFATKHGLAQHTKDVHGIGRRGRITRIREYGNSDFDVIEDWDGVLEPHAKIGGFPDDDY
jgi:hypothetical protein